MSIECPNCKFKGNPLDAKFCGICGTLLVGSKVEAIKPRIGRNDPCPCGSGRKYKNCHGHGF